MRSIGVDENVAITIFRTGPTHCDFLMPAVLSADRVGLNGEGQVLMHACILPVHAGGIGIVAFERLNAVDLPHHPLAGLNFFQIDKSGGPTLAARIFLQTPASQMMRTGNHSRTD